MIYTSRLVLIPVVRMSNVADVYTGSSHGHICVLLSCKVSRKQALSSLERGQALMRLHQAGHITQPEVMQTHVAEASSFNL